MDTYEKKYKEALELARVAAFNGHQSLMEGIFPELAESEDEKIRKEIIYHIKNCDDTIDEETEKRILAWLENIPYTIDHEKREGFHLGYKAALEKQCEQKPAWSEEDTVKIHNLITIVKCGSSIKTDLRDEYEDWLKSLRPQPKQEWSEEDEMTIKILIGLVETYFCGCIDKSEKNRVLDWLKSLKERIGG